MTVKPVSPYGASCGDELNIGRCRTIGRADPPIIAAVGKALGSLRQDVERQFASRTALDKACENGSWKTQLAPSSPKFKGGQTALVKAVS